jgi:hypothetical protein
MIFVEKGDINVAKFAISCVFSCFYVLFKMWQICDYFVVIVCVVC